MAETIKGIHWGVRSLVPAGIVLVHSALVRAEENAELLAIRGYQCGGTICPEFLTDPHDIVAGVFGVGVVIFSMMPVSEFFILYR